MCSAQLYSLAENPQLHHPLPPHLGSYTRALLVRQERPDLVVTPCWGRLKKFKLKLFVVRRRKKSYI
jgi:hypothetical protein